VIEVKLTHQEAEKLETFVSDHMQMCYNELFEDSEANPEEWQPYDLFDGCETCESREQLMATFDWLRSNGKVDIFVEE
jgi:hypothetical protein